MDTPTMTTAQQDTSTASLNPREQDMLAMLQAIAARLNLEESEHPGEVYPLAAVRQDINALIARITQET